MVAVALGVAALAPLAVAAPIAPNSGGTSSTAKAGLVQVDLTITYTYDQNGNRINEASPLDPFVSLPSPSFAQTTMPSSGATQSLSSTATATVSNGTAPYTYSWTTVSGSGITNSGGASPVFQSSCALVAGCDNKEIFQVTVSDANGKAATATISVEHQFLAPISVTIPAVAVAQTTMPASGAQQSLSTTVSANVANAQGQVTYQWSLGSNSAFTVAGNVTNAQALTVSSNCTGTSTCDYTNSYTVTVTDGLGRTATASVSVEQLFMAVAPSATANVNAALVQTTMAANGAQQSLSSTLTAGITNGQAPFTYQWAAGSNYAFTASGGVTNAQTLVLSSACTGTATCDYKNTYTVTITDKFNRTATAAVSLEQLYMAVGPSVAIAAPGVSQTTMAANGAAQSLSTTVTASVTNGAGPFTYQWAPGPNSPFTASGGVLNAQSLTLGSTCSGVATCDNTSTYTVTITDQYQRTATASVSIEQLFMAAAPSATASVNAALVQTTMAANGAQQSLSSTLTAGITNGQAPFTYQWAAGSNYAFTASGGVTNAQTLVLSSACTGNATCDYKNTYTVTITDKFNRTATAAVSLEQLYMATGPSVAIAMPSVAQTTMAASGAAQSLSTAVTATITNGAGPFTYQWAPGPNSPFSASGGVLNAQTLTLGSSCSGVSTCDNRSTYTVTITDQFQRTATASVPIEQLFMAAAPSVAATANITLAQMTMPAGNPTETLTQTLAANITNGQSPFAYQWSVVGGTAFSISNGNASNPGVSTSCASSASGCDTSATYQVVVTDYFGRTSTSQVSVEQKFLVAVQSIAITLNSAQLTTTMPAALNNQVFLGTIATANLTNGVAPFSYQWSYVSGAVIYGFYGPSTNAAAGLVDSCTNAASGCDFTSTYQVVVTDALGRTSSAPVTFRQTFYQALPPTVSVSPSEVDVNGYSTGGAVTLTGTATASPTGGLAPYTYSWAIPSGLHVTSVQILNGTTATPTFQVTCAKKVTCLAGGTAIATVTDALGHAGTGTTTVNFDIEGGSNN